MALILQFILVLFIPLFDFVMGFIPVVIWIILIFARCDAFFFLAHCSSPVFFVIFDVFVIHSCVPLQVVEVSCGHSCISQCIILSGGRIIITVVRLIPFLIRFVLCQVVTIVIIGVLKERTVVAVPYVKATWVASRQPVQSVEYVLQ